MNNALFWSLVLAHIIGDFYLQTDKCCKQKETRKFKSWFLYVHAITLGLLSWINYAFKSRRHDLCNSYS